MSTLYPDHLLVRMPPGTLARLRGVQGERESVNEIARQAIERELRMREVDRDNATLVLATLEGTAK